MLRGSHIMHRILIPFISLLSPFCPCNHSLETKFQSKTQHNKKPLNTTQNKHIKTSTEMLVWKLQGGPVSHMFTLFYTSLLVSNESLVWFNGLCLLLHSRYWVLIRTPFGYPFVASVMEILPLWICRFRPLTCSI